MEVLAATQVKSVNLRIGELRDVIDEWMQRYFDYLTPGTVAEGAQIKIQKAPIIFRCECGKTFTMPIEVFRENLEKKREAVCPRCGGTKAALHGGREFLILSIEVI